MDLSTVLLLSLSHLLIFSQTLAQSGPYTLQYTNCSNSLGNYTTDSPYQKNLNTLLSSVASDNQVDYGFYNLSVGLSPDQVNSIALCRGDVPLNDCRGCIINATRKIIQECPNQKEAICLFDFCMTLYSNRSLLGIIGGFSTYYSSNPNDVSDTSAFNQALQDLLFRIRDIAASGNSLRKFATGSQTAGFYTIYGLVQCTPNLSQQQCKDCLNQIIPQIQDCCQGKIRGRVITPSCNFRFETKRFYGETFPLTESPAPPGKKSSTTQTIIIVAVTTVGSGIIAVCICILIIRQRTLKKKSLGGYEPHSSELLHIDDMSSAEPLQFNFEEIRTATNDFSENNKIGKGGFGAVYEGIFSNGQKIAVKRLSVGSRQGDLEFKNEVAFLAKLQHRNLVRLLGFCLQGKERLLVYEFVPNKSLDHFLFDSVKREKLNWEIRYKIIDGIARGLLYLHEDSRLRIIHRDLKAGNVLLDEEMTPKISDFGMTKLFSMDQTHDKTSTIKGTYGYMTPEYARDGELSVKIDVYSYGVLVLEMLTGQKNSSFGIWENVEDLLSSAGKNLTDDTFLNIIDPTMRTDGSMAEMKRCVDIALRCVEKNAANRPTMRSVVSLLSNQSINPLMPSEPVIFNHSVFEIESDMSGPLGSLPAKTATAPLTGNYASITQLYPR